MNCTRSLLIPRTLITWYSCEITFVMIISLLPSKDKAGGCVYPYKGHRHLNLGKPFWSDAGKCAKACDDNPKCAGSTFTLEKSCYLHSGIEESRFYDACDHCTLYLKKCVNSIKLGCSYKARGHRHLNLGAPFWSDPNKCRAACLANPKCRGSTYDKSTACYLHSKIESSRFYDSCPDCTLYLSSCDRTAQRYNCTYNARGHRHLNLGAPFWSDPKKCREACQANPKCAGSTLDKSTACYLHSKIEAKRFYDACPKCSLFLKECNVKAIKGGA